MSINFKLSLGVAAIALAATSVLTAQQSVTMHMRNGDAVPVTLVDLKAGGFEVRMNNEERMIAKDQVAWVDFGGSVNVTPAHIDRINGNNHLVVFKNGDTLSAEWFDVGGTSPLRLAFHTSGGDRDIMSNEVARIYLSRPANAGLGTGAGGATPDRGGMQNDGSVAVMANQPWTDTGINVRSGEFLRFEVSRTIKFGNGTDDEATADGNASGRASAVLRTVPVRAMPVGGLIGRVGNGQPFAIGTAPERIRMPVNGRLWLGINDLSFDDNSGHFRVIIQRGQ